MEEKAQQEKVNILEIMEDKELLEKAEKTARVRARVSAASALPAARSGTSLPSAGAEKVKEKVHSEFGENGLKKTQNSNKNKQSLNKSEVFGSWATWRNCSNTRISLMLFEMNNKKNMLNNFRS